MNNLQERLSEIFLFNQPFSDIISLSAIIVTTFVIVKVILPTYLKVLKGFVEGAKQQETLDAFFSITKAAEQVIYHISNSNKSSDPQIQEELKSVKAELSKSQDTIVSLIDESLTEQDGEITKAWGKVLCAARNRLNAESRRLKERSTVNLVLGVAFSIISVLTLTMLLFVIPSGANYEDTTSFLLFFVPRLTIVLLLQVVATFFLKMHANNERDIERNKNQVTNLELKFVAIQISVDSESLQAAAKQLFETSALDQSNNGTQRGLIIDQRGLTSIIDNITKAFGSNLSK